MSTVEMITSTPQSGRNLIKALAHCAVEYPLLFTTALLPLATAVGAALGYFIAPWIALAVFLE